MSFNLSLGFFTDEMSRRYYKVNIEDLRQAIDQFESYFASIDQKVWQGIRQPVNEFPIVFIGGDEGTRTPDLYVANVPLSHLSYIPTSTDFSFPDGHLMTGRELFWDT